jgi:hypothetical protein
VGIEVYLLFAVVSLLFSGTQRFDIMMVASWVPVAIIEKIAPQTSQSVYTCRGSRR